MKHNKINFCHSAHYVLLSLFFTRGVFRQNARMKHKRLTRGNIDKRKICAYVKNKDTRNDRSAESYRPI